MFGAQDSSPRLVTVIVCGALEVPTAWLPNVRLCVDICSKAPSVPVPFNVITVGLSLALVVIVMVPVRKPAAAGVKFRVKVQ